MQIFIGAAKWMFINEYIRESMGIACLAPIKDQGCFNIIYVLQKAIV